MKGRIGYNHFCTYESFCGGYYRIGWYTDNTHKRLRYPKRHEHEVSQEEAIKFCEFHGVVPPKEAK